MRSPFERGWQAMWSETPNAFDPEFVDARDGFLSVSRTALFLMDLVAVQQFLDPHRLITPEVEAILVEWMTEHQGELGTLTDQLRSIMDDPAHVACRRDAVESMLGELVGHLPERDAADKVRSQLPHAS